MHHPILRIYLTATAACGLLLSSASAQTTATTDPVGAMTFDVPDQTDFRFSVPLRQAASFEGVVESFTGASVDVGENVGDLVSSPHYLLVSSGSAEGLWSSVVGVNGSLIQLEEQIDGLSDGDAIEVRMYWTLADLFPSGVNPSFVSTDPYNPNGFILANDLNQSGINNSPSNVYFYYSDGGTNDGWYQNGSFGNADSVVISPETFLTLRNQSGEEIEILHSGDVLGTPFSVRVVASSEGARDNKVPVPVPVDVSLGELDLVGSGAFSKSSDPYSPTDLLLLYDQAQTGINTSPTGVYFYYTDGGANDGWYENGSFDPSDNVVLPGGGAFVIRKGKSSDTVTEWAIPVSY